jgi:hypothetical protein
MGGPGVTGGERDNRPIAPPVKRQFRTGAHFARAELFDGLEQSLRTDHIYDTGARFVIDLLGALWGVEWIGIGGSYFWSDHFSGWSVGVDIRLRF